MKQLIRRTLIPMGLSLLIGCLASIGIALGLYLLANFAPYELGTGLTIAAVALVIVFIANLISQRVFTEVFSSSPVALLAGTQSVAILAMAYVFMEGFSSEPVRWLGWVILFGAWHVVLVGPWLTIWLGRLWLRP